MEKAIFYTSDWIDLFKIIKSKKSILLEEYVEYVSQNLLLTYMIIQEILQGVNTEKDFMQKQVALESFYILKPDWKKTSIEAAKLYFVFKKRCHC